MIEKIHQHFVRIYYEDTDAGGIVFYANYLKFFERGRTEWLREQALDRSLLCARGEFMFVVRSAQVDYLAPAFLDDYLNIQTQVVERTRTVITFLQQALRDEKILVSARIQIVAISSKTLKPVRLLQVLYS